MVVQNIVLCMMTCKDSERERLIKLYSTLQTFNSINECRNKLTPEEECHWHGAKFYPIGFPEPFPTNHCVHHAKDFSTLDSHLTLDDLTDSYSMF